jgi:hypothetical protein
MSDHNDLLVLGHACQANKRLEVVALRFETILLVIEWLGAASVAYSIWNNETNATARPAFDLVSPPIPNAWL